MFQNKRILGIIPARGGSKGIIKKNIVPLAGKPLIAWTIEEGMKSTYLDKLILSSECTEIIKVAKQYGCDVPFTRPYELSLDTTPGILPVLHAVREVPNYDYVVLLQPTSPLRSHQDIDDAIKMCVTNDVASVVSVSSVKQKLFWSYTLTKEGHLQPLLPKSEKYTRRQDAPESYALNGAIYVARLASLLETENFIMKDTLAFIMPQERSVDIDTQEDLAFCDFLFRQKGFI